MIKDARLSWLSIAFMLLGWVFKFECMVYENRIISTEKDKIMK
jgi:hypothetical protein